MYADRFPRKGTGPFSPPFADFEDSSSTASPSQAPGPSDIFYGDLSDMENAPKLSRTFTSLINAGHAMNFLDKDFLKQFRRARELLRFRYVRLEHFISSAVIPIQSGSGKYLLEMSIVF